VTDPTAEVSARMTASGMRAGAIVVALAMALTWALASGTVLAAEEPNGQVNFGNWVGYIDIDEETGGYPTLERFTEETGIEVTYTEEITDNEVTFNILLPDLAAGNPTGRDIIAPTDWLIERLIRLGYLEPLDHSLLPNVEANLRENYRGSWWDPDNAYSVPYVSGVVGIGYNPELTGREITSFDDLFDPAFAGHVGMFSEMRDTMSMTLLSMGVEPTEATIEDVEAAQQKLLEASQRGQFRDFYGNEYYDELARGDLWITMAWGGDVTQIQLYDNPAVKFVVPETGGMFYTDNMVIPKNAANPVDAHMLMDFLYDPENAATLIEYIGYYSPVKGVDEVVRRHAEEARAAGDDETADYLEVIAEGVYPTEEQLATLHDYKILDEEEERIWNDLFNEVVLG
jgi:spermidine/putrescine transport system substrate-binding protein